MRRGSDVYQYRNRWTPFTCIKSGGTSSSSKSFCGLPMQQLTTTISDSTCALILHLLHYLLLLKLPWKCTYYKIVHAEWWPWNFWCDLFVACWVNLSLLPLFAKKKESLLYRSTDKMLTCSTYRTEYIYWKLKWV